jgi:hypothetical protein
MKTTLPFIPFIRANEDFDHVDSFYSDAPLCRVTLERPNFATKLTPKYSLWLDLAWDGAQQPVVNPNYQIYIHRHGSLACLANEEYLKSPQRTPLEGVLLKWLAEVVKASPYALSVPQLPHGDGVTNNKINKLLFAITLDWHQSLTHPPKLILPVILTNQRQLNKKTERNAKVNFVKSLVAKHSVEGLWITDQSIEDQQGTTNFEKERFPGIIDFFKEVRSACDVTTVIAGPFWGLGLLLWARGLASHFAIGLGSTYRYYLPGGMANPPKSRVMLAPLRRWASSTSGLVDWLDESLGLLPANSPEHAELAELRKGYSGLLSRETAKRQVARCYRAWVDKIIKVPSAGRSVALFQDLSAAFVTGKALPDLPDESGPARNPERVAEQLMLNCL